MEMEMDGSLFIYVGQVFRSERWLQCVVGSFVRVF